MTIKRSKKTIVRVRTGFKKVEVEACPALTVVSLLHFVSVFYFWRQNIS